VLRRAGCLPYAPRHLIEQPIDACCVAGPLPVRAISTIAETARVAQRDRVSAPSCRGGRDRPASGRGRSRRNQACRWRHRPSRRPAFRRRHREFVMP
jgi:hypothetical protein